MTYDEYRRFALMIVNVMREFMRSGEDNVLQHDIIEKLVHEIEVQQTDKQTNVDLSVETSMKLGHIIDYLIRNENVLMVTQDAKLKNDRYLALNVNVDVDNISNHLQGQAMH